MQSLTSEWTNTVNCNGGIVFLTTQVPTCNTSHGMLHSADVHFYHQLTLPRCEKALMDR